MLNANARLADSGDASAPLVQLARTFVLFGLLISLNLAAWAWAIAAFHGHPTLLGTALLAWAFGLRHAMDADHIAAIDNVVRKLMQEHRPAEMAGFWFSFGHSTVVVLACVAITESALALEYWSGAARQIGSVTGTLISAAFLLAIAAVNMGVLRSVWRSFQLVRHGGQLDKVALDPVLAGGGVLTRLLRPLFGAISASWHMYPLGFLFGLGFDTATEIGVLSISATQATQGLSPWQAMVFPALFTAGMVLIDTTDSILMVRAYGWAFIDPVRKLWYNLTITAASVLVALLIGGVEVLGLLAGRLSLRGSFWMMVDHLGSSLGNLGFAVAGIFVLCWICSMIAGRWRNYHHL